MSNPNFVENFVGKYFMSMPQYVRVFVYIVIVLAFIHNYIKPTVLEGMIWIENESGSEVAGKDFKVSHGSSAFKVNCDGRWALTTVRKLPGSITLTVQDKDGCRLDDVKLRMPLPVLSAFRPTQYVITRHQSGEFSVRETAGISIPIFRSAFAQPVPSSGKTGKKDERWYVKISKIKIKESGDSREKSAELYFEVLLDGVRLNDTGLPGKEIYNTHLLISDGSTTEFGRLGFFLPKGFTINGKSELRIKIFDYDLFSKDDRIGDFKIEIDSKTIPNVPLTFESERITGRNWPHPNSTIEIEFNRGED